MRFFNIFLIFLSKNTKIYVFFLTNCDIFELCKEKRGFKNGKNNSRSIKRIKES